MNNFGCDVSVPSTASASGFARRADVEPRLRRNPVAIVFGHRHNSSRRPFMPVWRNGRRTGLKKTAAGVFMALLSLALNTHRTIDFIGRKRCLVKTTANGKGSRKGLKKHPKVSQKVPQNYPSTTDAATACASFPSEAPTDTLRLISLARRSGEGFSVPKVVGDIRSQRRDAAHNWQIVVTILRANLFQGGAGVAEGGNFSPVVIGERDPFGRQASVVGRHPDVGDEEAVARPQAPDGLLAPVGNFLV